MKSFAGILFDEEIVLDYQKEASTYKPALLESGILRQDPVIQAQMSTQGNVFTAPTFSPLTGRSQNSDGTDITTSTITTKEQSGVVIRRNNAWSNQDLATDLASADPMQAIGSSLGAYWTEDEETTLYSCLSGAFSAASMSVLVDDIFIEDGDSAVDANKLNSTSLIAGIYGIMGDAASKLVAMGVHTAVYANLVQQNLITFEPLSEQNVMIPKFMGMTVLFSDNFESRDGTTSGTVYTNLFFTRGAIGTATGKVSTPLETQREALTGGGTDILVSRKASIFHPYGISYVGTVATSPDDTAIELGTNWELVYDKKNVGIMAIRTNG